LCHLWGRGASSRGRARTSASHVPPAARPTRPRGPLPGESARPSARLRRPPPSSRHSVGDRTPGASGRGTGCPSLVFAQSSDPRWPDRRWRPGRWRPAGGAGGLDAGRPWQAVVRPRAWGHLGKREGPAAVGDELLSMTRNTSVFLLALTSLLAALLMRRPEAARFERFSTVIASPPGRGASCARCGRCGRTSG
jgi:hypothetical protein